MLIWDSKHSLGYQCFRCPECKLEFYGGGRALHNKGCSIQGYAGLDQIVGPKMLEHAQHAARVLGNPNHSWYGLTVSELETAKPKPADDVC